TYNECATIPEYTRARSPAGDTPSPYTAPSPSSTATTYSDTGLAHTTAYTYRVSAINSVGTGSPSATASATTLAVAPSPPTGLIATASSSSSQINLCWTVPTDNGCSAIAGRSEERRVGEATRSTGGANPGRSGTTYAYN